MQEIGIGNEIIKNIKHNVYTKQGLFVVDDLFILSLPQCKKSKLQLCLFCEEMIQSDDAKSVLSYYQTNCPTYKISKKTFDFIASKENCAGIIVVTELSNIPPKLNNHDFILVCDGLETAGNIGTIFRSADASQVPLIVFTNIKAKINDSKVIRASRGTIFTIPYIIIDNFNDCVNFLQKENARIVVCEPEQGINYKQFDYSNKVAIIVGSERFGVQQQWFNVPNIEFIKIPMKSTVGSLNVGVATSIVMFEAQLNKKII